MLHAYDSPESIAHVRDHILTALPLTEALQEQVLADSLRGAPQAKQAWPTAMMLEDVRSDAARINVPVLVLSGERDLIDGAERLRQELLPHIAGARLQILPDAGHLSMLETPKAVAQAIGVLRIRRIRSEPISRPPHRFGRAHSTATCADPAAQSPQAAHRSPASAPSP